MTDPAPSRRSRRLSVPQSAPSGDAAGRDDEARPAVVWARPVQPVAEAEQTTDAVAPPLTRRRARAGVIPAAESLPVAEPAEPVEVSAPVREIPLRSRVRPASSPVEPAVETEPFELLEPIADSAPRTEAVPERVETASAPVDEFEAAARLFSFTGETPVQMQPAATPEAPAPLVHVAPRSRRKGSSFKRVAAASFTMGAMTIVGLLAVGMTTPAQAVASVGDADQTAMTLQRPLDSRTAISPEEIQAYVAPAQVENRALDRASKYTTVTMAQIASQEGIKNFSNSFVNDPNSPIQWPFAVGVPISYGFGWRPGEFHEGVDFTPGAGAPIQAIADGVVRVATESGGGYGVTVIIDHVIDGQKVGSRYAHMAYGSLAVKVGQHVKVGQLVGRVGNTGYSFGAHMHLEILEGGTTPIDPLPWLRKHAGG